MSCTIFNFLVGILVRVLFTCFGNIAAVNQTLCNHPLNFIMNGFLIGTSGVAQFSSCFRTVKFIIPSQIVNREGCHERHFTVLFRLFFQTGSNFVGQLQRQVKFNFFALHSA